MAAELAAEVTERYVAVAARVAAACRRAGRPPESVRLVGVTKGVPLAAIRAAAAAGLRRCGENYVQEWQAKQAQLADLGLEWHFIGRLQRNKAAAAVAAALVHAIDDERVAAAVDRAAARHRMTVPILLQVNVAGEATKGGTTPAALPTLLAAVRRLACVRVVGLMTLPPPLPPAAVRPLFAALRELRDRQESADQLAELSMGMSGDFEVAIEEGATLVRVGTAIFGPRKEVA